MGGGRLCVGRSRRGTRDIGGIGGTFNEYTAAAVHVSYAASAK